MASETQSHTWTREVIEEIERRSSSADASGVLEQKIVKERLMATFQRRAQPLPPSNCLDELVFLPANLTRMVIDPYREPCSTATSIRGRFSRQPLELKIPLLVGGFPYHLLPQADREAMPSACEAAGSALFVDWPGPFPAHGKFILRLAAERPLPEGLEAVSPSAVELHYEDSTNTFSAQNAEQTIEALRKALQYRTPAGISLGPSLNSADVQTAAEAKADFLIVDILPFSEANPDGDSPDFDLPRLEALTTTVRTLRELRLEESVPILCRGGVRNGADAARLLALGATAIVIDQAALFAVASPERRATDSDQTPEEDEASSRLAHFLKATSLEITLMTRGCGKTNVHNLEPEDLRALTLAASEATGVPLVGH